MVGSRPLFIGEMFAMSCRKNSLAKDIKIFLVSFNEFFQFDEDLMGGLFRVGRGRIGGCFLKNVVGSVLKVDRQVDILVLHSNRLLKLKIKVVIKGKFPICIIMLGS